MSEFDWEWDDVRDNWRIFEGPPLGCVLTERAFVVILKHYMSPGAICFYRGAETHSVLHSTEAFGTGQVLPYRLEWRSRGSCQPIQQNIAASLLFPEGPQRRRRGKACRCPMSPGSEGRKERWGKETREEDRDEKSHTGIKSDSPHAALKAYASKSAHFILAPKGKCNTYIACISVTALLSLCQEAVISYQTGINLI